MTLRASFLALITAILVPALAAAVALVAITTSLHQAASAMEASFESIRAAEELQVSLYAHERTRDPAARLAFTGDLRRHFDTAKRFAASEEEQSVIAEAERRVNAYLRLPPAEPLSPERSLVLDSALDALDQLVQMNVAQGRDAARSVERRNGTANVLGLLTAAFLVTAAIAAVAWLRAAVVRPVAELADSLAEYTRERATRAPERGPTELIAIAREFNRLADSLAREQGRQLTFLAGVAHDLRNPLGALRFSAEMVPEGAPLPPEDQVRRALGTVRRQVDRMERLVGDLLDSARIEAGEFSLRLGRHDLREVVRETYDLFRGTSDAHALELALPDEPVFARCDPTRISQVVNNLVSNAIKYSPAGGRVIIELSGRGNGGIISVSDEGLGISPEQRGMLFEPFRRSMSAHPQISGVGLGLSVAKKIVAAHGGTIEVESRIPRGTSFHVVLPAERPARETETRLDA